jgi:hypothetical protein
LKLIGVIPQESDLTGIYESMLGSQVLGLYDPEKEEFSCWVTILLALIL